MGTPEFAANAIVMSKDIVAVDYWGREILKDNGRTSYDRSHYIDTAASDPYNLGTNDPEQMCVLNITNPATGIGKVDDIIKPERVMLQQNHPNPFCTNTQIRFIYRNLAKSS